MPRITKEKKDSILRTYGETKSLKTTAQIEKIDPRTVGRAVEEMREGKNKKPHPDSIEAIVPKLITEQSGVDDTDPDLELQLKANRLFDKGHGNHKVSQEIKLRPTVVIRYRSEYNEMADSDLDDNLRKKSDQQSNLERKIQERRNELEQLERRIEQDEKRGRLVLSGIDYAQNEKIELDRGISELKGTQEQLRLSNRDLANSEKDLLHRTEEAERGCLEIQARLKLTKEGIPSFIARMESLHEADLFRNVVPLIQSEFFRRAILTPLIQSTLVALEIHPKKRKILHFIRGENTSMIGYDSLGLDRVDFDRFIRDVVARTLDDIEVTGFLSQFGR